MKKIIFFFATFLILSPVFSQDNKTLFEQAGSAYSKKLYNEAATNYLKIINNGYESSEVYYNLGNTYYKQNDFTSAIYYYEKARKLSPSNDDILFNIKLTNTKIVDKSGEDTTFFVIRWWRGLYQLFSFDTWAIIGIVMLSVFLVFLSFYLFTFSVRHKKIAFWSASSLLMLTLLVFIFAQIQFNATQNQHEAIIFSPAVTAKSSPDASGTDLFVIHEGLKVTVTDNLGEWYEIKLSTGSVGWVKKNSLKII